MDREQRDSMIACGVIESLACEGIRATWEYPGFLSMRIPGPLARTVSYGRDGDAWYGQVETDATPWECVEVDEVQDSGIRHHVFVVAEIYTVLRRVYLAATVPPAARFPLACALVEAIDGGYP